MRRATGFSLVELMIALTLGLIVTTALLSVLVGTRSAFISTSGVAALTDGGRFALDFIQQSVRGAGFMACNNSSRTRTILNAALSPMAYDFTQPLAGFEANGTGVSDALTLPAAPVTADTSLSDWTANLDTALDSQVVKNSDVLIIRESLSSPSSVTVTAISDGASSFTVNNGAGLSGGQLAVISDCAKSAAFQITGISGAGVVSHNAGGGPPGNAVATLPYSFAAGSQVTPVNTILYFVGVGADGDSALFAYDLNGSGAFTARELVPDIENLQVLYGVDTSGTQTASTYVTADRVADFNTVMNVKVAVLVASTPNAIQVPSAAQTYDLLGTTVTAPRDTRRRRVFSMTIAVRNALP